MPGQKDAAWWKDYRRRKKEAALGSHATPAKTDETDTPDMSPTVAADVARETSRPKLPYLVAPDDDCGACHHDRHTYHMGLTGRCTAATGYHQRCDCPAYVEPLDLLDPF
jgi:hypothetical protein